MIRKTQDDGFDGTSLSDVLAQYGIHRMAVGGVMSEMCVAATARAALARGFGVVLPHDGHGTYAISAAPDFGDEIPAGTVARVAEWSGGDEIELTAHADATEFTGPVRDAP